MRRFGMLTLAGIMLVVPPATCLSGSLSGTGSDLEIIYHSPSLDITIQDTTMVYSPHADVPRSGTTIGPDPVPGQSVTVALEVSQVAEIRDWIEKYGIMNLTGPRGQGDPADTRRGRRYRLQVKLGGTVHRLIWTAASIWEDARDRELLLQAVRKLEALTASFGKDQNL